MKKKKYVCDPCGTPWIGTIKKGYFKEGSHYPPCANGRYGFMLIREKGQITKEEAIMNELTKQL